MLQHRENERDGAEIEHSNVLEKRGWGRRKRVREIERGRGAIYVVDIQKSGMAVTMKNMQFCLCGVGFYTSVGLW